VNKTSWDEERHPKRLTMSCFVEERKKRSITYLGLFYSRVEIEWKIIYYSVFRHFTTGIKIKPAIKLNLRHCAPSSLPASSLFCLLSYEELQTIISQFIPLPSPHHLTFVGWTPLRNGVSKLINFNIAGSCLLSNSK
jgi:hypothetical protein